MVKEFVFCHIFAHFDFILPSNGLLVLFKDFHTFRGLFRIAIRRT